MEYIPVLWCTTSSIESVFSKYCAHDCVTPLSFPSKIAIINNKYSISSLGNNKMYLRHDEEGQNLSSIETETGKLYKIRLNKLKKRNNKVISLKGGSVPLLCKNSYLITARYAKTK